MTRSHRPAPGLALRALGLALALASGGCTLFQDRDMAIARAGGPSPFSIFAGNPGGKAPELLERITEGALIALPPIADLPADLDEPLRSAIAEAAAERDIAVRLIEAAPGAESLAGHAHYAEDGRGVALQIAFDLASPEAEVPARFVARAPLPEGPLFERGGLSPEGEAFVTRLGRETATALRTALDARAGLGPTDTQRAERSPVLIALAPIDTAPGDGPQSLSTAITRALSEHGIAVLPLAPGVPGDFVLEVAVSVEPLSPQADKVALVWTVQDAAGAEVGVLSQANAVPHGMLDGPWGEVAALAAIGAAEGLVPLLRDAAAQGGPGRAGPGAGARLRGPLGAD
ncbi:MAG: hypothetical protein HXY25_09250 [Alphaproteobacteria bacterium]|nr:hypothetical protein [Alphaproteobacteria bacterium]